MSKPILTRYIQPDVLSRVEQYTFAPTGLVEGTLAGAHKSPFHGFAGLEKVSGTDLAPCLEIGI